MKNLLILAFLLSFNFLSAQNGTFNSPTEVGHKISTVENCKCDKIFSKTKNWSKGKRGGFYCLATKTKGKNVGKTYKRYFTQWMKTSVGKKAIAGKKK